MFLIGILSKAQTQTLCQRGKRTRRSDYTWQEDLGRWVRPFILHVHICKQSVWSRVYFVACCLLSQTLLTRRGHRAACDEQWRLSLWLLLVSLALNETRAALFVVVQGHWNGTLWPGACIFDGIIVESLTENVVMNVTNHYLPSFCHPSFLPSHSARRRGHAVQMSWTSLISLACLLWISAAEIMQKMLSLNFTQLILIHFKFWINELWMLWADFNAVSNRLVVETLWDKTSQLDDFLN